MGILDIFKKDKISNKVNAVNDRPSIKQVDDKVNYEEHINALHNKGIPLSQSILKLSHMDGFNNEDILKDFSVKSEGFDDGVLHYFSDDTVLLYKDNSLITNRQVKDYAKKATVLKEADLLFKQNEPDRIELSEELFVDLVSLEDEILDLDNEKPKNDIVEIDLDAEIENDLSSSNDLEIDNLMELSKNEQQKIEEVEEPLKRTKSVMKLKTSESTVEDSIESSPVEEVKEQTEKPVRKRSSSFSIKR